MPVLAPVIPLPRGPRARRREGGHRIRRLALYSCRLGLVFVARFSAARCFAPAMSTAAPNKSPPALSPVWRLLLLVRDLGGGGAERGWCGGDNDLEAAFCPPAPPTQRRVLRRRCGAREALFRSWPSCFGGRFQDPAWDRRLKASRSDGCLLRRDRRCAADLGSGRFRGSPWPTSHSDKFPAGDDGALLRSIKLCMRGCFSDLRWSPAVAAAAAETGGVRGCSVQGVPGAFSLISCFGGVSCTFAGPAVFLECPLCVCVLYLQLF